MLAINNEESCIFILGHIVFYPIDSLDVKCEMLIVCSRVRHTKKSTDENDKHFTHTHQSILLQITVISD